MVNVFLVGLTVEAPATRRKVGGNVKESVFQNPSNAMEYVLEIISNAAMDCALPIKEIVKVQLEFNN